MKAEEIFFLLGIEKTKDERKIKDAYRSKLTKTNPEDDPEGFKKLRAAYEEACSYARSRDEEEEPKDETPSGLWLQKAQELYATRSGRCDAQAWKRLFEDEVFISLDENEECCIKLLQFMMNHFQFPDSVWKLIEQNLMIVKDSAKLKEKFPADYVDFLVRRNMTGETVDFTLFRGEEDADYDGYIRCYNACWDALNAKEYEKVGGLLRQAEATGIMHPYMRFIEAALWKERGEAAKSLEILESLHDDYPKERTILYQLAEAYWGQKEHDRAARYYLMLKEKDELHYMANYRLAFWYAEKEDYLSAKECTRTVIRRGQDDAILELRRKINEALKEEYLAKWQKEQDIDAAIEIIWSYLQEDRFYAAVKMAEEIKEDVPEEKKGDYLGLLARIYMGRAEHEKAVETAEQWLTELAKEEDAGSEHVRNIGIAHRIKLSSYHMMGRGFKGYYEKAAAEYEELGGEDLNDVNILIEAAKIYLEKEDYRKCLALAELLLSRYQVRYANAIMMEAYGKLWDAGGVVRCGMQCIQDFPDYARAYEEVAKVYYDLKRKDDLLDILHRAKERKVESIYLDAYEDALEASEDEDYQISSKMEEFQKRYGKLMARTGKPENYEKGYEEVTKHLIKYPCNYILNSRGLFSMSAKEYEKALKDFYKILERDPADQFAHNNIGCVLKYQGKYEEALPHFQQAFYYMYREGKEEPNAMPLGNTAHTYELMGEYGKAAKVYKRLMDYFDDQKTSRLTNIDLSCNYARSGRLDLALELLDENMKTQKDYYKLKYRACLYRGNWKKAEEMREGFCRQISLLNKEKAGPALQSEHAHMLAWEYFRKGYYEEALKQMEEAQKVPLNDEQISVKTRIDFYLNHLFFLTIAITDKQQALPKEELLEKQPSKASSGMGFLGKFGKLLKGKNYDTWEEQLVQCATKLGYYIDQTVCAEQFRESAGKIFTRDLIHTKEFFYKDRYAMFVEFMIALYKDGTEAGEKALETMENSSRCRLCNHSFCMRSVLARALLCERRGRAEEARRLYQSLYERQKYNMYAWCGARMREN